ncbi:hypothetical protein Forpe1208_v006759 [Fusarium oxysporum f. sp. rapae]|uniref:Uncharacterized protein n=1 Tax=Fusarium oxysporum f. sp. rapae TaxID=485398 RepID=A0A8J5PBW5_FUSOX|nr:hypothetical protein Forpe1208_v006759 [Fusarium oxysporum f. sp. rapae]
MTSFASPEEPTDQWIDFHCPVNPRGYGYQSPSSSSTGAATSLAGYDWLDFSIAGDSASAFWSLCYDYYHGFDNFRNGYRAKFGKNTFVSSVVRFRWDVGKDVTSTEYETYMNQLEIFRKWFSGNIMGPDSGTLSDAILIMPYGEPHPEYRDEAIHLLGPSL